MQLLFAWKVKSVLSPLKFGRKEIPLSEMLVPSLSFPVMPYSQSKLFKDILFLLQIKTRKNLL